MRFSFHVKTNLTYDGRVLASIDAISEAYPSSDIRVSLLPDGVTKVELPDNVWIDEVVVPFRGSKFKSALRVITVVWYCIVDLIRTIRYRPDVIHIHDKTAAFAPFLYRILSKRKFVLIYDDHEIFNRPRTILEKMFWSFEKMIARSSDAVIVANSERGRLLKKVYALHTPPLVVENLFYDRSNSNEVVSPEFAKTESALKEVKKSGKKMLLHQGRILKDRGADILKNIPSYLPDEWVLCIIGVASSEFDENELSSMGNVLFLGKIQFEFLPIVYTYMDGAAIFYLPEKLNNRYCAPNRLYQAISFGLPLVVNTTNPVLSDIVKTYENGACLKLNSLEENMKSFFLSYDDLKSRADQITEEFNFKVSANKYVSLYRENLAD